MSPSKPNLFYNVTIRLYDKIKLFNQQHSSQLPVYRMDCRTAAGWVSGTPLTNAQSIDFSIIGVINLGVFAFVGFTLLTVSRLRHDTMLILALLIFVCWALLDHFPDRNEWLEGGCRANFYGAFTNNGLARATAFWCRLFTAHRKR